MDVEASTIVRSSILQIPNNLFNDYSLRFSGTFICPVFLLSDIYEIVGRDHPYFTNNPTNDTLLIDGKLYLYEHALYEMLATISNEFSVMLFYYVINRLNEQRKIIASEICNGGSMAKEIADKLRSQCEIAHATFKKYKIDVKMDYEANKISSLLAQLTM